jgi:hypothetical protein
VCLGFQNALVQFSPFFPFSSQCINYREFYYQLINLLINRKIYIYIYIYIYIQVHINRNDNNDDDDTVVLKIASARYVCISHSTLPRKKSSSDGRGTEG